MNEFCSASARKSAIAGSPDWNGLDFLHVVDEPDQSPAERQTLLLVHFVNELSEGLLSAENLRITGGERIRDIEILAVELTPTLVPPGSPPGTAPTRQPKVLSVKLAAPGDFSFYELRLVASDDERRPPAHIDRRLASLSFSFKAACPGDFDCAASAIAGDAALAPLLDYLARDYPSFRQLMLDRLALTTPEWTERSAADSGIALVELLAWVADQLAYTQDAVATEAYLGTARLRSSVRRHARLIDYPMHDGCNARGLVQLRAAEGVSALLVRRQHFAGGRLKPTRILSRCPGLPGLMTFDSPAHAAALASSPLVFELMHDIAVDAAHNDIRFHTWGARECCLAKGATRASLRGHFPGLKAGDLLILAEAKSPRTGEACDADPARRHAVRLVSVTPDEDPLGGRFEDEASAEPVPVTEIEWQAEDALPFALTLAARSGTVHLSDLALAHGNIVAIDHGMTLEAEELCPVPGPDPVLTPVGGSGDAAAPRYRPALSAGPLTQATPLVETASARALLEQSPGAAKAQIELSAAGERWTCRRDLLECSGEDRAFVVEVENDGSAHLRFGDGEFGRRPAPGTRFLATCRVGNGSAGKVGAGISAAESTLAHLVTAQPELADSTTLLSVWNPLATRGGIDAESIESVRRRAPDAIRGRLERAVTAADYETLARRVKPDIQCAVATTRWTGSWNTVFLSADREGGEAVDAAFAQALCEGLEAYRLAGQDLEIEPPISVGLELVLAVRVKADFARPRIEAGLREVLGSGVLADGRRALFHPDNFSFAQTVYLSPIVAAALEVEGVESVAVLSFRRQDQPGSEAGQDGCLRFARREIPRLNGDRNHPERGVLKLDLTGGR
ncbi:baseplate J/gp47 family protein [Niveibacterium terrae]|uniref:baseplate J/gp47 family protein n=1 Tax=Niveibacterium terrae TaxID=3373598 RepID=UPI003A9189D1